MAALNFQEKLKNIILVLLISSPIWGLLIFHFIPDKVTENELYEDGIKTTAKVEFYSIEKEDGSGKLGFLHPHDITIANYIYLNSQNKVFHGKINSGRIKILKDSTFQILYLENNPTNHLIIKQEGQGILGETRQ